MGRVVYTISVRLCRRTNLQKDARLFQIPPVPWLDELVIGGAVQLLPCSWQLEGQRRKRLPSSDTCDGLRIDGSHLVDARLAPEPGLGGVRIITGHDLRENDRGIVKVLIIPILRQSPIVL